MAKKQLQRCDMKQCKRWKDAKCPFCSRVVKQSTSHYSKTATPVHFNGAHWHPICLAEQLYADCLNAGFHYAPLV